MNCINCNKELENQLSLCSDCEEILPINSKHNTTILTKDNPVDRLFLFVLIVIFLGSGVAGFMVISKYLGH